MVGRNCGCVLATFSLYQFAYIGLHAGHAMPPGMLDEQRQHCELKMSDCLHNVTLPSMAGFWQICGSQRRMLADQLHAIWRQARLTCACAYVSGDEYCYSPPRKNSPQLLRTRSSEQLPCVRFSMMICRQHIFVQGYPNKLATNRRASNAVPSKQRFCSCRMSSSAPYSFLPF